MSRTITEDVKTFSDVTLTGVGLRFRLSDITPTDDTVAKRLRCDVILPVDRSDGVTTEHIVTFKIGDADVSTFVAGDSAALRGLLMKLFNAAKAVLGI